MMSEQPQSVPSQCQLMVWTSVNSELQAHSDIITSIQEMRKESDALLIGIYIAC